jgi:phosphoglycerol transferase
VTHVGRFLGRHPDIWLALGAGVTALAVAVVALRLWHADINVPIRIGGDSTQALGYVQNMIESGTPMSGPRLNAPFGQQYLDFPLGPDLLNFAMLRVISLVASEAAATVTVFFLLTFPLVAMTAYWALRGLGIGRPVAYFAAVVYAVVPFHFLQGTGHLFLSSYFAVPIAVYLLTMTARGRPLFGRRRRIRRLAGYALLALVVATTGIYYAAFTLLLIVPAAVLGWLRTRSARVIASAGLIAALIVVVLGLTLLPGFLDTIQNGPNADFPVRGAAETGLHQLRPTNLVIPVAGHYFPPFASLAADYTRTFPNSGENGNSAGLVASAGLALLVLVVLGSLVGAFARRRLWRQQKTVGALALICVLIGMTGGFSSLFALLVTPEIRAWGRIQTFVVFLAVIAVALALTLAWRYLRRTRWRNVLVVLLLFGVVFAAVDQTGRAIIPDYVTIQNTYAADGTFTRQVEASLPAGAAVYQAPYRPYPEAAPVNDLPDYEPLRPYLQSSALRFSYGGEKGREAGWQVFVFDRQPAQVLPLLCLAQFSAVWVDRASYGSVTAASVTSDLGAALAVAPMVDATDRYEVFDLRPYCATFQAGLDEGALGRLQDQILRPIWYDWDKGALPARIPEGTIIRDVRLPAQLSLTNAGDGARPITVSFTVAAIYPTAGSIDVVWPDGTTQTAAQGDQVTRTVNLDSGKSTIRFTPDQATPTVNQFLMSDFYALDADLLAENGQ